jgi:hypothetical protein
MNDKNLQPELQDIINRVRAYNTVHPEGIFVYHFIGWKKCDDNCDDCEAEDCHDESRSMMGIFGDLEDVRHLINDLRDAAEDNVDKRGFVSF